MWKSGIFNTEGNVIAIIINHFQRAISSLIICKDASSTFSPWKYLNTYVNKLKHDSLKMDLREYLYMWIFLLCYTYIMSFSFYYLTYKNMTWNR